MEYEIIKSFAGSQDGSVTEQFVAGTVRELSPYLVECIDPAWAKPTRKTIEIDNKAIVTNSPRRGRPPKP